MEVRISCVLIVVIFFAEFLRHTKSSYVTEDHIGPDFVSFRNRSLHSLPGDIPQSVRHLDLGRNFISSLTNGSFQLFPNLTCLDMSFNNLTLVDDGTFADMTSLVILILRGNDISTVRKGAFDGTARLEELDLSENDLAGLDFTILSSMSTSLRYLDLSGNRVENFVNNNETFLSLEHVKMGRNQLSILDYGWLPKFPFVKTLGLEENMITIITDGVFTDLNSLTTLDLTGNHLAMLTNDTCVGLRQLDEFRLGYNQLADIPSSCFTKTKSVRKLNLSGNKFETVPERSFQSLKNLQNLDISDSFELRLFEPAAFTNLENLIQLRLANNDHVTEIHVSVWGNTSMANLRILTLDSSDLLRTVPEALVDDLPGLQEVSLQNLNLKCDCELRWLQEWAELRDPVTVHLTNSVCVNALSPDRALVTQVKAEEMVCKAPYVISSEVESGQLSHSAQLKVTISNVGVPDVKWELPTGDILGLGSHHSSTNNQTLVTVNVVEVSTVLVCTLNITNMTADFYGRYLMTASNMAGNTTHSLVLEASPDVDQADLLRVQLTVSLVSVVALIFLLGMICCINMHHTNGHEFKKLSARRSKDTNSTVDGQQDTDALPEVDVVAENCDSQTFLQKEKTHAKIAVENDNSCFEQHDEFTRL